MDSGVWDSFLSCNIHLLLQEFLILLIDVFLYRLPAKKAKKKRNLKTGRKIYSSLTFSHLLISVLLNLIHEKRQFGTSNEKTGIGMCTRQKNVQICSLQ